jgi:hypothetical protein
MQPEREPSRSSTFSLRIILSAPDRLSDMLLRLLPELKGGFYFSAVLQAITLITGCGSDQGIDTELSMR